MICQEACPVNKRLLNKTQDTGISFSKTETGKILSGAALEDMGTATVSRLRSFCLADNDIYPLLKRNLSVLLNE
jgi:epoxyqueuosine reductase QueG